MHYLLWAVALAHVLTLILIRWVLLLKKREPTSSVAWILLIIMLPVLGGLLFLGLAVEHHRIEPGQTQGRVRRLIAKGVDDFGPAIVVVDEDVTIVALHQRQHIEFVHQSPFAHGS